MKFSGEKSKNEKLTKKHNTILHRRQIGRDEKCPCHMMLA
jgi:hypothetical protein